MTTSQQSSATGVMILWTPTFRAAQGFGVGFHEITISDFVHPGWFVFKLV